MNDRDRQRNHILTALAVEWDKHPDLRFGQLVENLVRPPWDGQGSIRTEQQHWEHCIFHTQDDQALSRILEGLPS